MADVELINSSCIGKDNENISQEKVGYKGNYASNSNAFDKGVGNS